MESLFSLRYFCISPQKNRELLRGILLGAADKNGNKYLLQLITIAVFMFYFYEKYRENKERRTRHICKIKNEEK
jgi:hypothetical protein